MYASVPAQNEIAVFNLQTLQIVNTINAGSQPGGMSFSPDGSRLYVADRGADAISVINTATQQNIGTLSIPFIPFDVAAGNGNRLYVSGSQQLVSIDATTAAQTWTRSTSVGTLQISQDRNTLYLADLGLSPATAYKYDVSQPTPQLLAQTPFDNVGSNGQDLRLSPNGSLLVYPTGSGVAGYSVPVLNTSNLLLAGSFATGPYPHEGAFSPDTKLAYVAADTQSKIFAYDLNTYLSVGSFNTPGTADTLEVDGSGRYLFASFMPFQATPETIIYGTGRQVPEPSSVVLALSGLLGLIAWRWTARRRAAQNR
jgi:YVTN family beta-propeller protein